MSSPAAASSGRLDFLQRQHFSRQRNSLAGANKKVEMPINMKKNKNTNVAMQLPGALALAAAGAATQANAATVQITFTGSHFSTTGNQLVADFGGDGRPDIGVFKSFSTSFSSIRLDGIRIDGRPAVVAKAYRFNSSTTSGALNRIAGAMVGDKSDSSSGTQSASSVVRAFAPIFFTDENIRSGKTTVGYLQIEASAMNPGEVRFDVSRLIFDDAAGGPIEGLQVGNSAFAEYRTNTIPEPSSLGLLALGAGGLLARRRRAMAA